TTPWGATGSTSRVIDSAPCVVDSATDSTLFATSASCMTSSTDWIASDSATLATESSLNEKVAEKAKANGAKKKMVQVTAKKSYARVREELEKGVVSCLLLKRHSIAKLSKLQMQLMERDDDA
ncbi:hypothetical protein Tco_0588372, partial [Tanacetum coccineum]